MIYLTARTGAQTVAIPMTGLGNGSALRLTIRSTVGLDILYDAPVTDIGPGRGFYMVAVTLPEGCPEGSAEYVLSDGGGTVSSGCVMIGGGFPDGVSPQTRQYNMDIRYGQYKEYRP